MRVSVNLLLFVLSYAGASSLVRMDTRGILVQDDNFSYAMRHIDEFDIIFAGSSVVENQIDPNLFDREMRERGYTVSSFNIGRGLGFFHEMSYLIRKFLDADPRRLQFIFIDEFPFFPSFETGIIREKSWHEPRETWSAIQTIRRSGTIPEKDKPGLVKQHLKLAVRKYLPVGTYFEIAALRKKESWMTENGALPGAGVDYGVTRGYWGFESMEATNPLAKKSRASFLRSPERHAERVRERQEELAGVVPFRLEEYNIDAVRSQVQRIERAGVKPVFLSSPSFLFDVRLLRALEERGIVEHVFYFDDPDLFPELYRMDSRFDVHHLNDEYSAVYTRLIAERFASLLDANPELAARLTGDHGSSRKKRMPEATEATESILSAESG